MILRKALAFIKRDFQIASSYQLHFIMTSLNSILILFLLFFISMLIDTSHVYLAKYGGDFFSYVLIGYGFFQYFNLSLIAFSNSIQREQLTGCLEAMLSTRTSPQTAVLMLSLYNLISSLIQLLIIFLAGILFFGFSVSSINMLSTIIVFLLSVIIFMGFGIISAAFIIVLKKGDPVGWLITSLNFILGGAFFPLELLPGWVISISNFVPAKYTLEALRFTILKGFSVVQVSEQIIILAATGFILFPVSLLLLNLSVIKAKKEGTLVQY
jgi:ABC-2 type transport system permease protein